MTTTERPQRANARRNRAALIAAAREVMGLRGLDAPLDDIAQHAGLGNATLYRHFPTRCELVVAVFTEQMTDYADAARTAAASADPWQALRTYLGTVCALQAQNRASGRPAHPHRHHHPAAEQAASRTRTATWSPSSTGPRQAAGCAPMSPLKTCC